MGAKEKIEAETAKANAKNQKTYEKAKAEFGSDGITKELKQVGIKTWNCYRCDLTFEDAPHALMHKDISRHSATQISKNISISYSKALNDKWRKHWEKN